MNPEYDKIASELKQMSRLQALVSVRGLVRYNHLGTQFSNYLASAPEHATWYKELVALRELHTTEGLSVERILMTGEMTDQEKEWEREAVGKYLDKRFIDPFYFTKNFHLAFKEGEGNVVGQSRSSAIVAAARKLKKQIVDFKLRRKQ